MKEISRMVGLMGNWLAVVDAIHEQGLAPITNMAAQFAVTGLVSAAITLWAMWPEDEIQDYGRVQTQ